MEKVLNQEQIDAMVRAARGGGSQGADREAIVVPWNARQAGQLGRQQLQSINSLHEDFAANLSRSIAAYLRVAFMAKLVSAEHLTYGEFLQRVPETTYLASCRLLPVDTSVLLQLDLTAAFPLIDVLLGGEGKSKPLERPVTAMESQILETVVGIICRELQAAWQILSLKFEFEQHQEAEQLQHLMAQDDKALALSFEIQVADNRGALNLVFPAVVSNALLRKMGADRARQKRRHQPELVERLREHLRSCPFTVELSVQVSRSSIRELIGLAPGMLLRLHTPIQSPSTIRIGNLDLFGATVARRGALRAGQVLWRDSVSPERNQSNDG